MPCAGEFSCVQCYKFNTSCTQVVDLIRNGLQSADYKTGLAQAKRVVTEARCTAFATWLHDMAITTDPLTATYALGDTLQLAWRWLDGYLKITVLCPLSSTRCSPCHLTARASTWLSVSRPSAVKSSTVLLWSTRATSCSMIGPSSRSAVT